MYKIWWKVNDRYKGVIGDWEQIEETFESLTAAQKYMNENYVDMCDQYAKGENEMIEYEIEKE